MASPKLAAQKNKSGNGIIVVVCAAFIVNHYDWSRSRFWRWTPPTACDLVVRKAKWTPTTQETAPRESGPGDRCSSFSFCWFSCREEKFQLSWPFLICPLVPWCPIGTWLCIIVFRYFSGGQLARAAQQRLHSSARHWSSLVLCTYLVELALQVFFAQEEWVHISL